MMIPLIFLTLKSRASAGLLLAGAACGLLAFLPRAAHAGEDAATDRAAYSQKIAEHYNFRFGADHPFLPSNATTDTGQFIDSKTFLSAKYCGHCHQEAYAEWRQTAHANSFRAPWYIKNTNMLRDEKGIEFTRHCEGCHNPTALVSGALRRVRPSIVILTRTALPAPFATRFKKWMRGELAVM